jgi:hypothetical protein
LNNGISKQVTKLTATDGFTGWSSKDSSSWRIGVDQEALVLVSSLADEGQSVESCGRRCCEGRTPIFVDAVTKMSFADGTTKPVQLQHMEVHL